MNDFDEMRANYHAHLDTCRQCRTQPFNMCPRGMELFGLLANSAVEFCDELLADAKGPSVDPESAGT